MTTQTPKWVPDDDEDTDPFDASEDYDPYDSEVYNCDLCQDEGDVSYYDAGPEAWGEDCCAELDHWIPCPKCRPQEFLESELEKVALDLPMKDTDTNNEPRTQKEGHD